MSNYYPGGCLAPSLFPCSDCPPKELGRVRSIFFLNIDYTFLNISNPAEWDTLICNQTALIVPYTQGSFEMSPKESSGFGNMDKELDSYECTIKGKENNPVNSVQWWNAMANTHFYSAGFVTSSQIVWAGAIPCQILPQYSVEDDIQSRVLMMFTIKWIAPSGGMPLFAPKPAGIFNQCIDC